MAAPTAFDVVCQEFERVTSLDRLEARGTVRLALKQGGLDARSVTRDQFEIILSKVMPDELTNRGIDDAESVCSQLASPWPTSRSAPNRSPTAPKPCSHAWADRADRIAARGIPPSRDRPCRRNPSTHPPRRWQKPSLPDG